MPKRYKPSNEWVAMRKRLADEVTVRPAVNKDVGYRLQQIALNRQSLNCMLEGGGSNSLVQNMWAGGNDRVYDHELFQTSQYTRTKK